MARLLLALCFGLSLAVPVTADVDIIPERRGFAVLLDAWDPPTGILHGTTAGPAGTGGVSVQILAATRIRRARIPRSFPGNPCRTDAENWNAAWAAAPNNPYKSFGDPAQPGNPMSPIVGSMVTNACYMKVRLNTDLATARAVKPYLPGNPI